MATNLENKLESLIGILNKMYDQRNLKARLDDTNTEKQESGKGKGRSDSKSPFDSLKQRELKDFGSKLNKINNSFDDLDDNTKKFTNDLNKLFKNKFDLFDGLSDELNSISNKLRKTQEETLKGSEQAIKDFVTKISSDLTNVNRELAAKAKKEIEERISSLHELSDILIEFKNNEKKFSAEMKEDLVASIQDFMKDNVDKDSQLAKEFHLAIDEIKNGKPNKKSLDDMVKVISNTGETISKSVENANSATETIMKTSMDKSTKAIQELSSIGLLTHKAMYSGAVGRLKTGIGFGEDLEFYTSAILRNIDMGEVRQMFSDYGSEIRSITGGSKENFDEFFESMAGTSQELGIVSNEIPKFVGEVNRSLHRLGISGGDASESFQEFADFSKQMRGKYDVSTQELVSILSRAGDSIDILSAVDREQNTVISDGDKKVVADRNKAMQREIEQRVKLAKIMGVEASLLLNSQTGKYQTLSEEYEKNIRSGIGIDMTADTLSSMGVTNLSNQEQAVLQKEKSVGFGMLSDPEQKSFRDAQMKLALGMRSALTEESQKSYTADGEFVPTARYTELKIALEQLQRAGFDPAAAEKQKATLLSQYGDKLFDSSGVALKDLSGSGQDKLLLEKIASGELAKMGELFTQSTESELEQKIDKAYITITGAVQGLFSGPVISAMTGLLGGALQVFMANKLGGAFAKGGIRGVGGAVVGGARSILGRGAGMLGKAGGMLGRGASALGRTKGGKAGLAITLLGGLGLLGSSGKSGADVGTGVNGVGNMDDMSNKLSSMTPEQKAAITSGHYNLGTGANSSVASGISSFGGTGSAIAGIGSMLSGLGGAMFKSGGASALGKLAGKAVAPLAVLGSAGTVYNTDTTEYRKRLGMTDTLALEDDDWGITQMLKDSTVRSLGALNQVGSDLLLGIPEAMGWGMFDNSKLLDVPLGEAFQSEYGSHIDEDIANKINLMNQNKEFIDPATGLVDPIKYQKKIVELLEETKEIHEEKNEHDLQKDLRDEQTKMVQQQVQDSISRDTEAAMRGLTVG